MFKWLKHICETYIDYFNWRQTKKRIHQRKCPDCGVYLECTDITDHFLMYHFKCPSKECGHEFRLMGVEIRPFFIDRMPGGERMWYNNRRADKEYKKEQKQNDSP